MEKELTNIELIGKQKWLVEPYLLKNSSDLTVENFVDICKSNIAQLSNNLKVCDSLSYENKKTKPALKQQINSAIEQLTAAYTQPQSAQELTQIVDDLLNDIDLILQDKKLLEFLLQANVDNSNSIENQLAEQGKNIQAKQKFASTFIKAKASLFTYSEEEQKQIKSKLSSMDRKVKKAMEGYQVYLNKQAEEVETEAASV